MGILLYLISVNGPVITSSIGRQPHRKVRMQLASRVLGWRVEGGVETVLVGRITDRLHGDYELVQIKEGDCGPRQAVGTLAAIPKDDPCDCVMGANAQIDHPPRLCLIYSVCSLIHSTTCIIINGLPS